MSNNPDSMNFSDIESRKGDHIRLCLDPESQAPISVFEKYRLPYTALPELSLAEIDTSIKLLDKELQAPLIIASMTGGSEHGRKINTNLAIAAETCRVALGVGSQRIGLEKPVAKDTFELVRKHAPNAFIIANMGAVQLNYGHGVDSYRRVVEMVGANAIYLHLNPLQEALQPGGDSDFTGLLEKINNLVAKLNVPIFVKEVGHGISAEVALKLYDAGVMAIDTAGVGGTSYAWVESERAKNPDFAKWFKDYGIDTDVSIQGVKKAKSSTPKYHDRIVIASGGIRSPIDGLKAHYLGADLFSAAVPFLTPSINSPEEVIETVENWKQGLRIAMFASGLKNWSNTDDLSANLFAK
jgi:isopentenyl-diphosphate delta-isomerase